MFGSGPTLGADLSHTNIVAQAQPESDDAVRDSMIEESFMRHPNSCPCPYWSCPAFVDGYGFVQRGTLPFVIDG